VPFQLSQRADFFEEEVGLETTLKRPIVNTRDEPHADAQRYRRLHVIVGDANLSEVSTFLKVGTTALVLCMIEDEFLPREWRLAAPVAALREVSRDLSLRKPLTLAEGGSATALEIQWEYFDRARKYADAHGLDAVGGDAVGGDLLHRWEVVLAALAATSLPPPDTRAWFRGECLRRFPDAVVAANWDSLVFDIGGDPLRRVPMMEPLRGTRELVGSLLDRCATAAELISALDAAAK
jgi:hypothetical protein